MTPRTIAQLALALLLCGLVVAPIPSAAPALAAALPPHAMAPGDALTVDCPTTLGRNNLGNQRSDYTCAATGTPQTPAPGPNPTIHMQPSDTLTVTCPTTMSRNNLGPLRTDLTCAAGTATATPTPTRTPTPTATNTPTALPTNTPTPTPTPGNEPPVAGQTCPAWLHAQQTTTGPDGQTYPTWHPPTDPVSGCHYRHEHGNDPGLFAAGFRPPFHYADRTEDGAITENHHGTKVYVLEDAGFNGYRWMLVHHFGTTTLDRACQRYHEVGVYVKRLSDGALMAELHFMADHGPARMLQADGNGAYLTPPGCPTQGQDAAADGSFGVRQIPHGATPAQVTAYEPWGVDNSKIKAATGIDFGLGINTPSLIDACANPPTCSQATRRGDDGSFRFLTYVGYGIRNAPAGTFWTDALGRTPKAAGSPGAVKQFVAAGADIPLKTRPDDAECYYAGVFQNGGWNDALAYTQPMNCGPDSEVPGGAHIGHGHQIGAGPN